MVTTRRMRPCHVLSVYLYIYMNSGCYCYCCFWNNPHVNFTAGHLISPRRRYQISKYIPYLCIKIDLTTCLTTRVGRVLLPSHSAIIVHE